jgi:hypothetical protein
VPKTEIVYETVETNVPRQSGVVVQEGPIINLRETKQATNITQTKSSYQQSGFYN